MTRRIDSRIWLLALVILGLVLRLQPALSYWINGDEGIYYFAVHSGWQQFWQQVEGNAHPPLFYLLLRPIAALGSDPLWLRLPSILFSCLGIWGMYLLARNLGGRLAGLIAAGLWTVLPATLEMGVVARPYAMQWTCLVFALFGMARYVLDDRRRGLLLYSGCMTVALLLHYSSFLVAAAVGLHLFLLWVYGRIGRRDTWILLLSQLPILLGVLLLYLWHVQPALQSSALQNEAVDGYLAVFMIDGLGSCWRNLLGIAEYLAGSGFAAPALILWLASLALLARQGPSLLLALSALCLGIAILLSSLQLYPFGSTRHSGYFAVLIIPCMAIAVARVAARGAKYWATSLALFVALILLRAPLDDMLGLREDRTPRFLELRMPRAAAEEMVQHLEALRSEQGIIISDSRTAMTLDPFLHQARDHSQPSGEVKALRIPWGDQRLLIVVDWELGVRARTAGSPQHLDSILRQAQSDPELAPLMARSTRILSASGERLARQIRRVGEGGRLQRELVEGLIVKDKLTLFSLDAAGYLLEIEERKTPR